MNDRLMLKTKAPSVWKWIREWELLFIFETICPRVCKCHIYMMWTHVFRLTNRACPVCNGTYWSFIVLLVFHRKTTDNNTQCKVYWLMMMIIPFVSFLLGAVQGKKINVWLISKDIIFELRTLRHIWNIWICKFLELFNFNWNDFNLRIYMSFELDSLKIRACKTRNAACLVCLSTFIKLIEKW